MRPVEVGIRLVCESESARASATDVSCTKSLSEQMER